MTPAEKTLREQLENVDDTISRIGWGKANDLLKSYRHWIIQAIQFIQLRHFAR